ncbi:putative pinopsin-like [Scophthalmus maximus]|uniref:Putative pinopsin-like n=1 Tax=Scophthalmus maximus TaxID=52904 RepID=A0A2U9CQM8_SCOMX|nr:putative pinopsin-like [Scophthalmus maximus]
MLLRVIISDNDIRRLSIEDIPASVEELYQAMQLGILIGYEDAKRDAFPHKVFDVAVVVKDTIVLHNIKDVPFSFAMLMGVIYCVNLEYES